jgi:leucyl-tRNA synthetase
MKPYVFSEIEPKWRARWETSRLYRTPDAPKRKFYVLEMFAYPSGDIHMGHFRNYSIGDAVARFKTMRGFDVLHPFGWDAFGQPAEGAAIKRGNIHPYEWTIGNIETGKKTLQRMGLSYDWEREIRTCEPDYYRWTQWIFLQLYKAGLAYRASSWVNWCPRDEWALTNEQAEGGVCWRCKSPITQKELQGCWFFRTSRFAERLLKDIDRLEGWPETVRKIQRDWIGRSEGTEIEFGLEDSAEKIRVFTTRPDTLYGVTFMAVSPESPYARSLASDPARRREVEDYIRRALSRDEKQREKEKDGVFTGRHAVHPLRGERVQLWVADYVLGGYGTGVVMGVPAHDSRDFEFAKKYSIPVRVVIEPEGRRLDAAAMTGAYVEDGVMSNSGPFDGVPNREGIARVTAHLKEKGWGGPRVNFKLRDWLVSRQRYWGCPIPIVHCASCGEVPVPEKDLPVVLPLDVTNFVPKGRSPLADTPSYLKTSCPRCGGAAERDPDTMDTFMDSSWYQFRYLDPRNDREIWSKEAARAWAPIDLYIGGIEHARGHCLYFRFITKFLHDLGWLPVDEPAVRLFNHGMVCDANGEIMSKSRGNAIAPGDLFDTWGIDVSRVAMFFFAPSGDQIAWSENGVVGADRFVRRLWDLIQTWSQTPAPAPGPLADLRPEFQILRRRVHQLIQKTTASLDGDLALNTSIARMMELLNFVDENRVALAPSNDDERRAIREAAERWVQLVAPLAPFMAEELWETLGHSTGVFRSSWPQADPSIAREESLEIVLQVNGKVRGKITVPADTDDAGLRSMALAQEPILKALEGRTPKKVIVVKGRLVNVVG